MTRQRYTLSELDEWIARIEKEVKSTEEYSRERRSAEHDLERVTQWRRELIADEKEREENSRRTPAEIVDAVERRRW